MIKRNLKLRWRRSVRRHKRQVEGIGTQTEQQIEKHFFKRLNRLVEVRRFVISWVLLLVLLIAGVGIQTRALGSYFLIDQPVPGGTFNEGILGAYTNANPIYASGAVDNTVSRLVFSGLLKYDQRNRLVGDLAEQWSVDERRLEYTVVLRSGLEWHDGRPLTSEDVVFTYETIRNPDARSPLITSWRDIDVEATDERTVVFTLPNVFSPFPHSLTNGIIPHHILEDISVGQLRSEHFNTIEPIGSGPFRLDAIEVSGGTAEDRQEQIGFTAYEKYHLGTPKLQQYIVRTFRNEEVLLQSLERKEVNAASGLNSLPDDLNNRERLAEHNILMTGQVAVFLNNSNAILGDVRVRRALVQSVDQVDIIRGLGYPVIPSRSPLLPIHVGFDDSIKQLPFDIAAAEENLEASDWKMGEDGIRTKDGQPLSFRLFAQTSSEYTYVTQKLQSQWRKIGVDVQVTLQPDNDLQTTVAFHNYDALLYGISLGTDPDVFAYWHSSQADVRSANRLNFSEYSSEVTDEALEAGRTRSDPELRAVKYEPFLQSWRNDAPAAALYQPRYLYVIRGRIHNFNPKLVNSASDRLANVHNWMIREEKALK
jgi:peptide/nickel transport system substrate-binding protein